MLVWECTELITGLRIPDLAAERGCVGHMGDERDLGISLIQVALLSQSFLCTVGYTIGKVRVCAHAVKSAAPVAARDAS